MIELRHLRYFLAVAEELHFGRAAERLYMAQSPLSQQIRQLEATLGVELLSRGHHVVGLTDAGRSLQLDAQKILEDVDRAVRRAQRASRGELGALTVGYLPEVTDELLPLSLRTFRASFPDVDIELHEGTAAVLLDDLRRGAVDVSFQRAAAGGGDICFEPLVDEPLVAALPAGSGRRGQWLTFADLAAEPLVLPRRASAPELRRRIDAACAAAGFSPRAAREASPLTAVLLLVSAGAGVAIVPASAARAAPVPGVEQMPLADPGPGVATGVAWRAGDPSTIVANFLQIARDVARSAPR